MNRQVTPPLSLFAVSQALSIAMMLSYTLAWLAIPIVSAASSFNLYEHLGNLSPYFQPENTPAGLLSGPPETCTVDRAFLIHRHGSRQPISGEIQVIQSLGYYINNNTAIFSNPIGAPPSEFEFLTSGWTSEFILNDLSATGRQELFSHGVALRLAYPSLYTTTLLAGGQDRVVESAQWFAAGYYGRYANSTATLDVIGENEETVSWITPMDTCSTWEYASGNDLVSVWDKVYLPAIATRINKKLAPTFPAVNFTAANAHGALWACAYGTAVGGKGSSPWCPIFLDSEILDFEYELDLLMRGAFGYGLPTSQGPVLGSLLVSNVTAFMTDASPTAQNLSMNFAHDTTIDMGLTALGLANDTLYPATGPADPSRKWKTSTQVPFAAQMLWTRLDCGGEQRIQLLQNGANFDLSPTGCTSDLYGTCSLEDFLATSNVKEAQSIVQGDVTWSAACGAGLTAAR